MEEAKVQLGVCVAAQVARIKALIRYLASVTVQKLIVETCPY